MSDTPRTNALLTAILDSDGFLNQTNAPERWVNLCREIEHDCDEARKLLEDVKKLVTSDESFGRLVESLWNEPLNEVTAERDQLRAEVERLKARVTELTELLVSAESREDAQKRQSHSNYVDYRDALAEVERLKADKARLDFCDTIIDLEKGGYALHFPVKESTTIRGAIDAAMKGAE